MDKPRESYILVFFSYFTACSLGLVAVSLGLFFTISFIGKICEAFGTQKIVVISIYFVSVGISYLWIKLDNYTNDDCPKKTKKQMLIYSCLSGLLGPLNIFFILCAIWDAETKRIFLKEIAWQKKREKTS